MTLSRRPARGLLGQASILTVTSFPNRTSPVVRGKWLLENMLGTPPPAPPPDVPALTETKRGEQPRSVRERMEQHRKNPACASCHAVMDPLGFALENFDAIGRWRTTEGGVPVDCHGRAARRHGRSTARRAARAHARARGRQFVRTVTEKLMTYALGRGVEHVRHAGDSPDRAGCGASDYRWSSIILGITKSDAFQMRMAAGSKARQDRMIITKMAIPRRTVLRGLGATIALPLLDSMVPALTARREDRRQPVRRLGIIYIGERRGAQDTSRRAPKAPPTS